MAKQLYDIGGIKVRASSERDARRLAEERKQDKSYLTSLENTGKATLPQTEEKPTLTSLQDTLNAAIGLARKKRTKTMFEAGENFAPGTLKASDFSAILNNLDAGTQNIIDEFAEQEEEARKKLEEAQNEFELRQDAAGNLVQYEKDPTGRVVGQEIVSYKPRDASGSAPKGTVRSGGLIYTPQDQAEDSRALEQSRGPDGYVYTPIYIELYKEWVGEGGTIEGFKNQYPPKEYVNPADPTVPPQLRTTGSKNDLAARIDSVF